VAASAPLLTEGLRAVLNPLVIDIRGARRLPGLVPPPGCDPDIAALAHPSPHTIPRRTCRPVFASVRIMERSELRRAGGRSALAEDEPLPIHVIEDALGDVSLSPASGLEQQEEAAGGRESEGEVEGEGEDGDVVHAAGVTMRVLSGVMYPAGMLHHVDGTQSPVSSRDEVIDVGTARRRLVQVLEDERVAFASAAGAGGDADGVDGINGKSPAFDAAGKDKGKGRPAAPAAAPGRRPKGKEKGKGKSDDKSKSKGKENDKNKGKGKEKLGGSATSDESISMPKEDPNRPLSL